MSSMLGVTIESAPDAPSVVDVRVEKPALLVVPEPQTGQPYIPSYPGEPCFQQRSIHVSGRSPTTDMIAFSPKEWPVETHPVTKEARKTLQILQIGCELSQDDHASCYSDANAFDATSAKSNTKRYG